MFSYFVWQKLIHKYKNINQLNHCYTSAVRGEACLHCSRLHNPRAASPRCAVLLVLTPVTLSLMYLLLNM